MKKLAIVLAAAGISMPISLVRGQDRIIYTDRAKKAEQLATGAIEEETPAKIVYKVTAGRREIAAADIIDIEYQVPGEARLEYRRALNQQKSADKAATEAERTKLLNSAISTYKATLKSLASNKLAQRHVQFKIAQLTAQLAGDESSERDAAIAALETFKKQHPNGWQIVACCHWLARLQMQGQDYDGALKTYEDLAKTPNIAPEVQREAELLSARALTRAKRYAEAQKRLQAALKSLPRDDPQVDRVQVYLAECQARTGQFDVATKQLESIINKTTNNDLKALAYNTLGDCYLANERPRDAMWAYLWVDVVYHQDKQEHRKALEELAKIFERFKDENRAKEYRERLQKAR
ncbi:MAG TPA: tetratricopeptide repeat protein [Gemmataceae bacterium]|nr:tetratricopeptide repeat protein [Gemmataceae bacterium]